jgi:indoleamine 2,3-dioxygenase
LSEIVGRPPILSYADYALNNWKRIDKNSDISLGNIQLIQKFNNIYDEDWFILVHVEIEARAGRLLKSIYNLTEFLDSGKAPNDDFFAENLEVICSSFKGINTVLERMPEKCSPDVYFRKVRPYIFGFENVVYENVPSCSFFSGAKEQSFRGETGAQSSIVPAVLAAFGVKHQQSILTHHLDDMRKYMPRNHRGFVSHLEGSSVNIRDGIINNKLDKYVRATYNNIILQLCRFREIHFGYAVDYIQKKCDNPTGTGGTPYVKWLKELTEETKSYLLKTE